MVTEYPMMATMRILLVLVAFLARSITSVQSDAVCPLNFESVPPPFTTCFSSSLDNFTSSQCCYTAYVDFAVALAQNTNQTGQLFLNADQEAACANEAINNNLIPDYCEIAPPIFTANEGPCLFPTEADLASTLSAVAAPNPISLDNLTATCANVEQESGCDPCRSQYYEAVANLESSLAAGTTNDSSYTNCRAALLVSLTSHNVSQSAWQYGLYSCLGMPYTQPVHTRTRHKLRDHTIVLAALLGLALFGLLALIAVLSCIRCQRRYVDPGDNSTEDKTLKHDMPYERHGEILANEGILYEFSSKELLKATDNFTEKNCIGEGSAGKVYIGALPSGQTVAVKLIMNEMKLGTFYKEIENLSLVRHSNLVTLLGYCQASDMHLLVYEYCSKGNLWYYLFGGGHVLTWDQRLNIALGSARGLMYLHMNPGGSIVHRDIKPTNILLNDNYEAKVSDFGLSRFIAIEESHVLTEVKGTAGYMDPEYLTMGALTFSSDVYSFGIVLLQLISGRRPIDLDPMNGPVRRLPLVKSANLVISGGIPLSEFVDARLEGVYPESSFQKVVELGVQCTLEHGAHRPSIAEVRQRLEEAWYLAKTFSPEMPCFRTPAKPRRTSRSPSPSLPTEVAMTTLARTSPTNGWEQKLNMERQNMNQEDRLELV